MTKNLYPLFYLLSFILFPIWLSLQSSQTTFLLEWTLASVANTPINISLILDPLSTLVSATVMLITGSVMMFSNTYMSQDPFKPRFDLLLVLFVLSMNMLIFIPHLICLLIGWDGLGILSFVLVIYYQTPKALSSGMITALTNRIGDAMILISISLLFHYLGHWSIWAISELNPALPILIILAAMTKSAQMPFSSWLPAAMAAPTPVSALVHSSTLVTAGVYLMIRFHPLIQSHPVLNKALMAVGALTMLMAGTSAMVECDLKKIIALSTLSQLSIMIVALALGQPNMALFHLITHAMFKALLFICAGSLIHLHDHSQDIRQMGNLSHQMPITMTTMLISNLSLCGLPFLSGFFSKHAIVEMLMFEGQNLFILIIMFLALTTTMIYSARLIVYSLISPSNSAPLTSRRSTLDLNLAPIILCFMSIIMGALLSWTMPPTHTFMNTSPQMSAAMTITPMVLAYVIWKYTDFEFNHTKLLPLFHMWFLTPISAQFNPATLKLSLHMFNQVDQGWLEPPVTPIQSLSCKLAQLKKTLTFNQFLKVSFISLLFALLFLY